MCVCVHLSGHVAPCASARWPLEQCVCCVLLDPGAGKRSCTWVTCLAGCCTHLDPRNVVVASRRVVSGRLNACEGGDTLACGQMSQTALLVRQATCFGDAVREIEAVSDGKRARNTMKRVHTWLLACAWVQLGGLQDVRVLL